MIVDGGGGFALPTPSCSGTQPPCPMTPTSRPNLLWPTLTALVMLAGGGCAKNGASGVRDPEKASLAEHDVAVDEFNKGSLRSALVHAQKAVEFNEDNSQAQLMAATIYLAFCATSEPECRLGEAEQHARAALKIKPDFASATNTLGVILVRAKRYDDAIAVLKPLTENMVYSTPELAWATSARLISRKVTPIRRSSPSDERWPCSRAFAWAPTASARPTSARAICGRPNRPTPPRWRPATRPAASRTCTRPGPGC